MPERKAILAGGGGAADFIVAQSQEEDCPYLPGQRSLLPLRLPIRGVEPAAFDVLLAEGDRRAGPFLYRTACPSCTACEPLRIPTAAFRRSKSQREIFRRSAADIRVEIGLPRLSSRHLEIFNRHKLERGLGETASRASDYRMQFLETCVASREIRYLVGQRLIGVSLIDIGENSASSVYHYFDPDESKRSLGVFSVLTEIELCAGSGLDWYYLGLYVEGCGSLRYKAGYYPHERRIGGSWRRFEGAPARS